MKPLWSIAQAGLFLLDPEAAHEASLRALEAGIYPRQVKADDPRLAQTVFGLRFPNPVGVAAGYDKDGRAYNALLGMGFGFAEAGTVTPRPQPGNPRPRLFRLPKERAVINRLGFNSEGHEAARARLLSRPPAGIVGVNVGANKDAPDAIADYVAGIRAFAPFASYITVNISSPNTPGLRDLQAPDRLDRLLHAVMAERNAQPRKIPILVKIAPDIHDEDIGPIMDCLIGHGVSGAILTNTTIARAGVPPASHRGEAGGLSGRPLFNKATRVLAKAYLASGGRLPLVGAGGIDSGEAALAKIRAGASLLQLYTGLIYEGPCLLSDIKGRISKELGDASSQLSGLVGADAERWSTIQA